jgi:cytochrome c oxidase subunit 2
VTSTDVIHAFSLPALGIKLDAVPYRLSYQVPKIKDYDGLIYGFCSELCGRGHALMPIEILILRYFYSNETMIAYSELDENLFIDKELDDLRRELKDLPHTLHALE